MSYVISTNIVKKDTFREVTSKTLEILANTLSESFGPLGSNSAINETDVMNKYSKDGRTILNAIKFNGILEETIRNEVKEITRTVDLKVGDGTTSAIILANIIYGELIKYEKSNSTINSYELIRDLQNCVTKVSENILKRKQPFTAKDAYDITKVSTNGDTFMAETIRDLYSKLGSDIYIDVKRSNDEDTKVKYIDSLTLDAGYTDPGFINKSNNTCELNNPVVYAFSNNIDTPEMAGFMREIISHNILRPLQSISEGKEEGVIIRPTVIMAPSISRDQTPYLESLLLQMNAMPHANKIPLLIITSHNKDAVYDIAKLCGCNMIQKYIDARQQDADIKSGLAPTLETIHEFAGTAKQVISDATSSSFVEPGLMFNEDGTKTDMFKALTNFVKTEIAEATRNNEGIVRIGKLKRRLRSLEGKMVELYIGGISSTDVDYYKDLVEDATKNCRSAALNGVGYGANIEGLISSEELVRNDESDVMMGIINDSYIRLVSILYKHMGLSTPTLIQKIYNEKLPININTNEFDSTIKCSIETDIEILNSVVKIVSILFTSNQFIASSPGMASPYHTLNDYK